MSAKKKGTPKARAAARRDKGATLAIEAEAPLVNPAPLGISRWGWIVLTIVDALLFVVGIVFARIDISIAALVLAFLIEKFAHQTLMGKYEARQEALRAKVPQLTKEQRREVIKDFRETRKAARQAKRESRRA